MDARIWPIVGAEQGLLHIMERISPRMFIRLERLQSRMQTLLRISGLPTAPPPKNYLAAIQSKGPEPDLNLPLMKEIVSEWATVCEELNLRHSLKNITPLKNYPPETAREVAIFWDMMMNEVDDLLFIHVPQGRGAYWQREDLLSTDARKAYPELSQELRSAANCYAFSQPTACVFHCMRALETALASLARAVGLEWTKEQWHNIIEMIEANIKKERDTLPRGTEKDERLYFLSQAAKEFFYFKDGWRNYVAHKRIDYLDDQALQALEHTVSFTEHLATQLKESPYRYG